MILVSTLINVIDSKISENNYETHKRMYPLHELSASLFTNVLMTLFILSFFIMNSFSNSDFILFSFAIVLSLMLTYRTIMHKQGKIDSCIASINSMYEDVKNIFKNDEEVTNETYDIVMEELQSLIDQCNKRGSFLMKSLPYYFSHGFIICLGALLFFFFKSDYWNLSAILALAFSYKASRALNYYADIINL